MISKTFAQARFLIVDDELANISVLTQMLEAWDAIAIASTTDPRDTRELMVSFEPDIILLDLMMPHLSGFDVMKQLEPLMERDEFLPILVLTADNTGQTRRRALEGGAADFLTKPFDAIELSLRVQNLLTRRFLQLHLRDQNRDLDQKVRERTEQLQQVELDTIECLAMAAEFRDDDTGQHTQRVGRYCALIARALGLSDQRITLIERAAPLHDVGKIGIADSLLLKPGRLTPDEFEVMKTHAQIGSTIMARHHTPLLQLASSIALTHHERWNGSGYPRGLCGEAIPLEGRIVSVADVFDALTHERPYKRAWSIEEATDEIAQQSGKQFDPEVVCVFQKLQSRTLCSLNS